MKNRMDLNYMLGTVKPVLNLLSVDIVFEIDRSSIYTG